MVAIRHKFLGRNDGNFDPQQIDIHAFIDRIEKSFCSKIEDASKVFFPSCALTTRVVVFGAENYEIAQGCMTTKRPADGIVIDHEDVAGVIFSADAPTILIFEPNKRRFALLHGALRCLLPKVDARGKRPRGIIRAAFEDFKIDPVGVKTWAGVGIGPCCFGCEHHKDSPSKIDEIDDATVNIPVTRATRGPRAGKKSIDLFALIKDQLLAQGVKSDVCELDTECVCCQGNFNHPKFHSNCRSGKAAGRNAIGFWMA